jgi:hypothetical protein
MTSDDRVAPTLQTLAAKFLKAIRWKVEEGDAQTIFATRRVGGNELRWALHFEDEKSFSQLGSPSGFVTDLMNKGATCQFFDLIGTDGIFATRRWTDEVAPVLDSRFKVLPNRHYGTWTRLLNRYVSDISTTQKSALESRLKTHFIRKAVRPHYADGSDALKACADWLVTGDARIMVVRGDAGAGKSVFTLLLASELAQGFTDDPSRYPAPFLIWFSSERPAVLEDLISKTLQDLSLTDLTVDAVKFLLSQGRIVFIIDGFDEISRALAQQAAETVDKLSAEINRKTSGRLILTARPAFLVYENIFSDLATACEEDRPTQRELSRYSDEQIHQWIVQNAPDRPESQPPDRHWQRVQNAFGQNPALRELCRTPVFLRMLSEILVKQRSIQSRYQLIEQFCEEMWERERSKRTLVLSDKQYLLAYEAISVAIVEEKRINFSDLKAYLELYFEEYAPDLLGELPGEVDTLLKDLAIGPLTCEVGHFAFAHEILTAYFFARRLARSLASKEERLGDLWNRKIYEPSLALLPEAIQEVFSGQFDASKVLGNLSQRNRDGLMLWNIARSVGGPLPAGLFRNKHIAGLVFEDADFRGMSFDESTMHDVTFVRCRLSGASFRGCKFGRIKFIECDSGALFDDNPLVSDETEVVLNAGQAVGEEAYFGEDARKALRVVAGAARIRTPLASDLAERAVVIILASLFKRDGRKLDYPEPKKVENRLRGWLRDFELDDEAMESCLELFMDMFKDLMKADWICRNPNRPRTVVPCGDRAQAIVQVVRTGAVPYHEIKLREMASAYQSRIEALTLRE